jgi:RecB family exonuclease
MIVIRNKILSNKKLSVSLDAEAGAMLPFRKRALIVGYIERDDTTYFHSITVVKG